MKILSRFAIVAALAGLLLSFAGCASVPMSTPDQDAKAKGFSPLPGRASLYIYRNENFGAAIPMTVSVNKRMLGQTAAKTYFQLNVAPGRYTIESNSENVSTLNLWVDAGKNYFVWQEVKMGMWSARSALQQVDETKGRAGVLESKLIATTVTESDLAPAEAPTTPAATAQGSPTASISQQLQDLENLRKANSITEEEYQKLRAGLIAKYQK
jgi:hypothetical protein